MIPSDELHPLICRASHEEAFIKTPEQFAIPGFSSLDFEFVRDSSWRERRVSSYLTCNKRSNGKHRRGYKSRANFPQDWISGFLVWDFIDAVDQPKVEEYEQEAEPKNVGREKYKIYKWHEGEQRKKPRLPVSTNR